MQAADRRDRDDGALRRRLHASCRWRVFLYGEMGSSAMIVGDVRGQEPSQMPPAEDDHVVETLAPHGSDAPLRVGICQGLDGLDSTSPMPMPATRRRNTSP